jgi:gp16 family phage-associated protein
MSSSLGRQVREQCATPRRPSRSKRDTMNAVHSSGVAQPTSIDAWLGQPSAEGPPASDPLPLRSPQQVLHWFHANGVAVSHWAEAHGFSPALARAIVSGKRKCLRGQSHQIAVALRIKAAPARLPPVGQGTP